MDDFMKGILPVEKIRYPSAFGDYIPSCGACFGNLIQEHKEKCFFFESVQDMGAHIPTCSYYSEGLGHCPCKDCDKFIDKSEAAAIVRDFIDKR